MTEKEAIKKLEYTRRIRGLPEQGERWEANEETIAIDMAIKALKGIEKYRAIGTVEGIKEMLQIISEGQDDVDESGISTGLLHTLLEYAEYAKIGTVEECREARERQKAEKPILNESVNIMFCPICERKVKRNFDLYCSGCGQKLD